MKKITYHHKILQTKVSKFPRAIVGAWDSKETFRKGFIGIRKQIWEKYMYMYIV